MNLEEYMERRCVCGRTRGEHAHFQDSTTGGLRVLVVNNTRCTGFLDEIELALGGNPQANPLLAPLIEKKLQR